MRRTVNFNVGNLAHIDIERLEAALPLRGVFPVTIDSEKGLIRLSIEGHNMTEEDVRALLISLGCMVRPGA